MELLETERKCTKNCRCDEKKLGRRFPQIYHESGAVANPESSLLAGSTLMNQVYTKIQLNIGSLILCLFCLLSFFFFFFSFLAPSAPKPFPEVSLKR